MMREYKIIDYSYDLIEDSEEDWESIDHPRVNWLKQQREESFSIRIDSRMMAPMAIHRFYNEIYVSFLDEKLEIQFLLKFCENFNHKSYSV